MRILFTLKSRNLIFSVLLFISLVFTSCYQNKNSLEYFRKLADPVFPYDLGKPSQHYKFPKDLREISGLEYFRNGLIAGIQDEDGYLYLYDTKSKSVARKIKFAKHGDYEGVAVSGDHAFVINSKGDLYEFTVSSDDKVDAKKRDLPFGKKNNLEGLCFNPADSSLLIVCKDDPGIDDKIKGRAVYRYDLNRKKVDKEPFLHITSKVYFSKLEDFNLEKKVHTPYRPSGIAVNPDNGFFYLIASVGKLLIVFDREKNIVKMVPLPRSLLHQPEGICFSPEGDLFISSEGGNHHGYMLQFPKIR